MATTSKPKPKKKAARDLSKDLIPCVHCSGKGQVENPATIGATLRQLRLKAKQTAKAIADEMGLSQAFICDAEAGRRTLTPERIAGYRTALANLKLKAKDAEAAAAK